MQVTNQQVRETGGRATAPFFLAKAGAIAAALVCGLTIGGACASDLSGAKTEKERSVACTPAVLKVVGVHSLAKTHYTVQCDLQGSFSPFRVEFKGVMAQEPASPYSVNAVYSVGITPELGAYQTTTTDAAAGQITGEVVSVTSSIATLPTQFSALSHWDADSNTLSVQERPDTWRIYAFTKQDVYTGIEQTLTQGESVALADAAKPIATGTVWTISDAGYASVAISRSRAYTRYVLDEKASRFSGPPTQAPIIKMAQGLRAGKLENLIGATRVANQEALRTALILLDRNPKDVSRAWAAGAIAKFLGLNQEVQYVELKVATHSPQLLEDFRADLAKIHSYQPPAL